MVNASSEVTARWMGEEEAGEIELALAVAPPPPMPWAMRAPASRPKMAAKKPSTPGAVPSTRAPRGFLASKSLLDVYRRRHVPRISGRVAGRASSPCASRRVTASAMARSSAALVPAPRPDTPRRRETSSASSERGDEDDDAEDDDGVGFEEEASAGREARDARGGGGRGEARGGGRTAPRSATRRRTSRRRGGECRSETDGDSRIASSVSTGG